MAIVTNRQSWGEGRTLSEAAVGVISDAYQEARWSVERLDGGKNFVSGQGRRGITFSYAHLGRGGGVLW